MIYYEKFRLAHLLSLLLIKKRAFYCSKSIAARYIEGLLEKLNIKADARKVDFGDVETASNIRRTAYEEAELYLDRINGKQWAGELSNLLSIDFELIAKKFFFDELYIKYEFIELALRY